MGAAPRQDWRRPAPRPGGVSRLLPLLLLLPPVARAAPEPVQLALSAHEGALEFWVRTQRTELAEGRGVRASRKSHDTLDLNLVAVTRFPDATYQAVVDVLGRERSVDGGPFEELTLEPRTYSRKLGPRLERAEPWPDDVLGPVLPLLPEKPVSPGERWSSVLPASGPVPFPVSLEHSFLGTAAIDGLTCFVIETVGTERGRDPATGLATALRIDSALALDAASQALVKLTVQTRSMIELPRPDSQGFQWFLRRLERVVQRRAAEGGDDAGNPVAVAGGGLPGGGFPGGEAPGAAPDFSDPGDDPGPDEGGEEPPGDEDGEADPEGEPGPGDSPPDDAGSGTDSGAPLPPGG